MTTLNQQQSNIKKKSEPIILEIAESNQPVIDSSPMQHTIHPRIIDSKVSQIIER
jgi:hypothetical protein